MDHATASAFPFGTLGIIGTGRTARAFGLALAPHCKGKPLIHGRSPEAVAELCEMVGGVTAPDAQALLLTCDLIVLAVTDDAMDTLVAQLSHDAAFARAPFIFHLSGRSGATPLAPLARAGAHIAAIHPAMTFIGDSRAEAARMAGACFAISAPTQAAQKLAQIVVERLGGRPIFIAEEKRALYHAALTHAANHLVTLIAGASDALGTAGVPCPDMVLAPLVRAALENSLDKGMGALSGPLLRGDEATIGQHLAALGADAPAVLPAYCAMAVETARKLQAQERGVPERLDNILNMLSDDH